MAFLMDPDIAVEAELPGGPVQAIAPGQADSAALLLALADGFRKAAPRRLVEVTRHRMNTEPDILEIGSFVNGLDFTVENGARD